ncbi:MAG TPA: gliding motility-associated C-terminal domain-containing protein, partial [Saprospiraceae bacterium]|nr:gliding motility-associated C-terminal domain-containing protein [Saprospiraceae bacterium]
IPPLNLGNDTSLCESELLLLEINIPDVSITWFDGSQNNAITIVDSGMYTAEIANACGASTDTLIVTSLPEIPQLILGPDQFLCPGEVINFSPGIPDVQYLWQDGSTGNSYSTTQAGSIILTISNACGTSTDSLLITESTQGPQLNLGPDITACTGDTLSIQVGFAGVTYTWQDGSTNPFYLISSDAELSLHIANACGTDDDTIAVQFITLPDPDLGPDTLLCDNALLTLNSNSDPGTTTTWQDGSQLSVFVVTASGIYSLQQSNFCGAITDSIVVTFKSSPTPFSLGPDIELCPGESVILHAPVTFDALLWQDGSDSSLITANKNQVYSLTISNACGTARDEVNIAFDADVPVVQFDSMSLCPGEVLTLDVTQPFDAQYNWSTGATNSSIDVLLPGEYAVTVMTNCYDVSEVVNVATGDCRLPTLFFIPNVFSPNGDGVNDIFSIQFNADVEVISVEGDIFDRWGNLVFGSTQNPFSWDGTFDDKTMNPAVFVYRFTLAYSFGGNVVTKKIVGDVTLIH